MTCKTFCGTLCCLIEPSVILMKIIPIYFQDKCTQWLLNLVTNINKEDNVMRDV